MRILYKRRSPEDLNIVPFNLPMLWLMQSHINIQKVTESGWEFYLGKYLAKAEPSMDLDLSHNASEPQKYLRSRIMGRLEAINMLMGYNLCRSSKSVVYLPTDLKPTHGIVKRTKHMPDDPKSKDIYYDTLLDKYLDRPEKLENLLYPDYIRKYQIGGTTTKSSTYIDRKNRTVNKRTKEVIPRWNFYLP